MAGNADRKEEHVRIGHKGGLFDRGHVAVLGHAVGRNAALAFTLDVVLLVFSIIAGFSIRSGFIYGFSLEAVYAVLDRFTGGTAFLLVSSVVSLYLFGVYSSDAFRRRTRLMFRILAAQALAFIVTIGLMYLWSRGIGRGHFAITFSIATTLLILYRVVLASYFTARTRAQRTLIAGAGWAGAEMIREIEQDGENDYEIIGLIDDDPELMGTEVEGYPVLSTSDDACQLLLENEADHVVVAVSHGRTDTFLRNLLRCKTSGARVVEMADLYKAIAHKVPIKHVTDQWFILGHGFDLDARWMLANAIRILDLTLAVIGLTLAAPILLVAAAVIKITSPGPVFFTQDRVGEFGREFTLIKLRTMRNDAESKSGPVWSRKNDARVTPVGKFLRRTRIDELPQMINVLRGEMSFVGPRPERRFFVDQLTEKIPYYELRHTVKPGISGWAQVCYRYTNDEEGALEKLQFDLYYIQEMSLFLYGLVILKTIQTVVSKPGS
jgi:exopolysaccharide biosynthesis polyprenyl glycosylphosphotransferase